MVHPALKTSLDLSRLEPSVAEPITDATIDPPIDPPTDPSQPQEDARPSSPHFHDMHDLSIDPDRKPKRLILAFDGTGNSFKGNTSDTNIVKLYDMFDRNHPQQLHYYQPGIGTYTPRCSVNPSFFGRISRNISQTIDSGFATSFDDHVISGYKFLMRFYEAGDKIFVLGFSRGAFTARFLARMISHVGLLSKGNEEMVPFAYKVYQDYETGVPSAPEYMQLFKTSFCRDERKFATNELFDDESGIKVHFLGLFDCVNSVGTLDIPFGKKIPLPKVQGTAEHVRHAVAVDERRVKFKAALFAQDAYSHPNTEDIKEVWFPGNHCDIGGGYLAEREPKPKKRLTKEGDSDTSSESESGSTLSEHKFQLSDITLKWMIDEIDHISGESIAWNPDHKCNFLERFQEYKRPMIRARMHDTLSTKGGSSLSMVTLWNFLEYFPFIKRWEYITLSDAESEIQRIKQNWAYIRFPLNQGARRDIPPDALFHHALLERMALFTHYKPDNEMWLGSHKLKLSDVSPIYMNPEQLLDAGAPHFLLDLAKSVGSVPLGEKCSFTNGVTTEDHIYTASLGRKGSQQAQVKT